ncbi:putative NAC domain-containing protein 94 [Argentina anserina]|uniref:putative NAC domain-containing protein 94 n=1 Tax=Argentina anserina TaxID=57926 RepID=UPI0021765387|nr:putative NAC domain-containing protein 94 [Potentilla anserina]
MEEIRGNQLIPGQRFCPMDDELVLFYLKPMLCGENVPGRNQVVFDCDLYGQQEPWEIWESFKSKRPHDLRLHKDIYFFTRHKKMSSTDKRIRRNVGSGTWHSDSGKPVRSVETGAVVGLKKRLTYKNEESVQDGCWILHEFFLDRSLKGKKQMVKNYVLCLLRKNGEPKTKIGKKRKQREEKQFLEENSACDDGEISGGEQEVLLDTQAKKRRTVPSIDDAPETSEDDDGAFVADHEESLDCIEVENAPSSEAPQTIPLEDDDAAFVADLEESLECVEDENAPSSKAIYFQGGNSGEQPLAANHGISNMLPEEDFLLEMEEFLLNGVSSDINVDAAFDGSSNGCGGLIGFEDGVCMPESLVEVPAYEKHKHTDEDLSDWLGLIDFSPEANEFLCNETQPAPLEVEASCEVYVRGGNDSGDAMVGEDWLMAFMEGQENEQMQNTMEVGEWNSAAYVDFGYNLTF